jgi:diguanylate cyclase (GGDEF)-like protein
MDNKIRILLLADDSEESQLFKELLSSKGETRFEVHAAGGPPAGPPTLARAAFDAVLFGLRLPDSRGLTTYFKLRVKAPHVPLIVLTNIEESSLGLEVVRRGAQDSLVKSHVSRSILVQSIKAGIDHMKRESRIREVAFQDPLTGLLSRAGLLIAGGHSLRLSLRTKNPAALVFADIDRLEDINREFGFEEGDSALRAAAAVMKKTFRSSDIMARLDADEFVLLAPYCAGENAGKLIDRWKTNLEDYLKAERSVKKFSLSLGSAGWVPESPASLEQLMVKGELDMWQRREKKTSRSA